MRLTAAILVLAGSLTAQEGATRVDDAVFAFTTEQGWSLTAEGDRDLFAVGERDLTQGLQPTLLLPGQRPGFDLNGRPLPPQQPPPKARPLPPPRNAPVSGNSMRYRRLRGDLFKADGSVMLRADESVVFSFNRLDYFDGAQRWWIEFDGAKIRTFELGGVNKWTGSRAEWAVRLEDLERSCLAMYLKAVVPQRAEEQRAHIGLVPTAQEPGKRLAVTSTLEEQLAVLLVARLEGVPLTKTLWPAETAKYPPGAIQIARAFVGRILAQCAGELAPARAKVSKTRSVKDQPWEGPILALPIFHWPDGSAWSAEHAKPVQEARKRLSDLALQSNVVGGIDETVWRDTVRKEVAALEEAFKIIPPTRAPTVQDPLNTPRLLDAGKATYDYKEELGLKDGKLVSCDVEAQGFVKESEVAYFLSGANRWKACKVRFEDYYKGEVKRK